MNEEFGERLRAFRQACGLTQAELAELCFVTQQAVARWERGESLPQADRLPDIAHALGFAPEVLLGSPQQMRHKEVRRMNQFPNAHETPWSRMEHNRHEYGIPYSTQMAHLREKYPLMFNLDGTLDPEAAAIIGGFPQY